MVRLGIFIFWGILSFTTSKVHAEQESLTWGGDASGGAPYLILDQHNPEKVIGFEVEFAEALAREMGMKSKFVQHQWDNLIPGLNRGNFDIALNGIEITEARKANETA